MRARRTRWSAARALGRSLRARLGGRSRGTGVDVDAAPLRAELFSADQMAEHGRTLARDHRLRQGRGENRLLARLDDNERVLDATCRLLTAAIRAGRRVTPAGEWLLDNHYIVDQHVRTARQHLPKGYSSQLPRLANGASAGLPRIYDIALNAVSHGDGRFDLDSLSRFVAAYQQDAALDLGELWAIPIMLRLALLENLRRVAARVARDHRDRDLAAHWGDTIAAVASTDPKSLILAVADMARSEPPVSSPFVAELMQRLYGQVPARALPLSWLEQRLAEAGLSIEQLVQAENQQQAADQMTVSNSMGSLRLLLATDWRDFVEDQSEVDRILAGDPDGTYPEMDFGTRDAYRHVVERLARRAHRTETEVAQLAIALAAADDTGDPRRRHVGFVLVDRGTAALERALGLMARGMHLPLPVYLGGIALFTLAITAIPAALLAQAGLPWAAALAVLALLGVASSQLAVAIVNQLATLWVAPRLLPRMDDRRGIPASDLTLVVVPTLLADASAARQLVEDLEVRFLANRDEPLRFALLSDFPDALTEHLGSDAVTLAAAIDGIEQLNRRYGAGADDADGGAVRTRFYLLHRPRRWNPGERSWMGTERKRGKLAELNALLRGAGTDCFSHTVGEIADLRAVRYVITLDADTQLPRDVARELVATLRHPLNRPRFDPAQARIVAGYGILQPRVGTTLRLAGASAYAWLFGGDAGIDPYTQAVSDVYQDLFGEGSYTGKGIYDVDAFEQALAGSLPGNRILSHDLIEGCYARAGLISDVALFENFPQDYDADLRRRHRWIRGDWQIARWLWPRVPRGDGQIQRNPLSALSRWKIFDNLRRSLVAPSCFALLMVGWCALPAAVAWTAFILALPLLPALLDGLAAALRKPSDEVWRAHLGEVARGLRRQLLQLLFNLACLPFESAVAVDAIVRTLWRQQVSRRRLLEWTPSSVVEQSGDGRLVAACLRMSFGPVTAAAALTVLAVWRPAALPVALPLLLGWTLSPWLAWRISRAPVATAQATLAPHHRALLRLAARRTWHYFERTVGPDDHHLPPDNLQEEPAPMVAHRTSPTNIGLYLLATLAAHDFGYLGLPRLLARLEATFATLARLERYRGHFYNWYDTRTLAPLAPRYVSTVDSGNLGAHLLTLRQGLSMLCQIATPSGTPLRGLIDTAAALQSMLPPELRPRAARFIDTASAAESRAEAGALDLVAELAPLLDQARALCDALPAGRVGAPWAEKLVDACEALRDEAETRALHPGAALAVLAAGGSARAGDWLARLQQLVRLADEFNRPNDDFLYDRGRDLYAIGFNVDDHRRDPGYYDLLASEARQGIFVAVAQGRVPQKAWFSLGRLLTHTGGSPLLLSWSGSMFEYLMPGLVMPSYPESLLAHSERNAVHRQIDYGRERGVPWGISESGYHLTDAAQNFQYRAFGVPGMGLTRGLAQELVIAPYATALALLVTPDAAAENLARMAERGWLGDCGYYEAIDFSASRLLPGQSHAVLRSFMAHHQGMSLIAFAHVLLDRPMQRRFEADPQVQSALLLLQERVPRRTGLVISDPRQVDALAAGEAPSAPLRVFNRPDPAAPAVQLLSNGRYHVLVSSAGGGYSQWRDLALTRWQADPTRDDHGSFCYLRDVASGRVWSTAFQPTLCPDESYEAVFTEARVEFRRRLDDWECHTEIVVSPEDDIELRRTRITNRAAVTRVIEITSYAEVVLAPGISDSLHPAFSKLFVETEVLANRDAILCSRRPRSAQESSPWLLHLLHVHAGDSLEVSFDTDRARFIGRGRDPRRPRALDADGPLHGSSGAVLDPIVAIRHRLRVQPEQTVHVDFVLGVGSGREHCLQLVDKYRDRHLADRVVDVAWTHSQVSLRQINVSEADAQTYARLAGRMLYPHPTLRADAALVMRNRRGQPALWPYAISGDLPILLVQIGDPARIGLVRDAVQAHAYWRSKGLLTDLVILNEERGGYRQELHDVLLGLVATSADANLLDRPGGIFVRASEQIPHDDRALLLACARCVLIDAAGSLSEHLQRRGPLPPSIPLLSLAPAAELPAVAAVSADAVPANGYGSHSADRREYRIHLPAGVTTPAPWINVIANPSFGCIVSEAGAGYTWCDNAHEFRLSPWHNDPVRDAAGEAFYLRDEDSGRYWSPSALPARGSGSYVTRHGFGYSVFEHVEDGIASELRIQVATDAPVKFFILRLRNRSGRPRRISATGYVEWVLGDLPAKTAMHIVTELDPRSGALFARNAFHPEFGNRVAFFDVDEARRTISADRLEFIGRNGSLARPAALERVRLSGRVGALMDPCAAIQVPLELADGQSRELIFRLGAAAGAEEASALVIRLRAPGAARTAESAITTQWDRLLGAVQVETPDASLDALANGWLLYQVLSCRLWARSGYYQSGGAFGFRDQLQDSLSLVHAAPELLRDQILLCASRQFRSGDVQHWWHPPSGRGVRTRCSDDLLWLPLATCRYLACSGDFTLLDQVRPLLDGRVLAPGEESYYDLPHTVDEPVSVYRHCVLAIERALGRGPHDLPLIGAGDWNDGMNRVGIGGSGESVWLGFFLHRVLSDFEPIAAGRGDAEFAARCRDEASHLRDALEAHGWDGSWYRRAYFDDGTPMGAAGNPECRIDAIAQSWAILSGAVPAERSGRALDAVFEHLVSIEDGLVRLLTPPFDGAGPDPGYIRGYLPGVRENGGQYTHAAIWAALACVAAGRGADAWRLFDLINPGRHARTPAEVERYKVEPYVMAADVYAVAPHTGRGGWTWYTGSAAWMYRLIVESLLGLRREGDVLCIDPMLPPDWPGFGCVYRHGGSRYRIRVVVEATAQVPPGGHRLPLVDDGVEHVVELRVGVARENAPRARTDVATP